MKGEVEKGKKDGSKSCPCVMFAKRYEANFKDAKIFTGSYWNGQD